MKFTILPSRAIVPSGKNECFLITDQWNDWHQFVTQYYLIYRKENGTSVDIGSVKIGEYNMEEGQVSPDVESKFDQLDSNQFFSLGQSAEYYSNLDILGFELRTEILKSLNDIAYNLDLFHLAKAEAVTRRSLMREFSNEIIQGEFHRLSHGAAKLHRYHFEFVIPKNAKSEFAPTVLDFFLNPRSMPPTNVHILIGGNGVGKTFILNSMVSSLLTPSHDISHQAHFIQKDTKKSNLFSNLLFVSFSAFDDFPMFSEKIIDEEALSYAFIGLKEPRSEGINMKGSGVSLPKTPKSLALDFVQSLKILRRSPRMEGWLDALELLTFDPIFNVREIASLAKLPRKEFEEKAITIYEGLSTGHKSILLSLTKLVELVKEKSLVLIDEPEAHLHPPLLSGFIRVLSELIRNRNGIAIIASHSPVILQEVPKSCVWIIRRDSNGIIAERPENETFGENVSVLTRDVFSLEVTNSGFHKLIKQVVTEAEDYADALEKFDGELGGEAKAILQTLMIEKLKQN